MNIKEKQILATCVEKIAKKKKMKSRSTYEFLMTHLGTHRNWMCHRWTAPRPVWQPVVRVCVPNRRRGRI